MASSETAIKIIFNHHAYNCGPKIEDTFAFRFSQNRELFELGLSSTALRRDETLDCIKKYETA